MSTTTIRTMLNAEPHHFEAKFDKRYAEITADDVLKKATEFLKAYTDAFQPVQKLPDNLKDCLSLRYITHPDDAFGINSAPPPGSPLSEKFPSTYSSLACDWYRSSGYNLSSDPVDRVSLLASKAASPDTTRVRWYIILVTPAVRIPGVYYTPDVALGLLQRLTGQRDSYLKILKSEIDNWKETKMPSPSMVGKNTGSHRSQATVFIDKCPQNAYGQSPSVFVPIFAEAYNELQHPKSVELERATREDPNKFDITQWLADFKAACYETHLDEHNFNLGVVAQLQKLLPFIDLEPHVVILDDEGSPATEMDWRGTCLTAHSLRCLLYCGEGKKKYSEGGNPISQAFLALQRMLVLVPDFAAYMKITSCPTVVMTVVGNRVNVWVMYFTDKIVGEELFSAYFGPRFGFSSQIENNDLAVKFQVLRNTVKKLYGYYKNLHGWTALPHMPHFFPQPIALLRHIVPAPENEVIRSLASLDLAITAPIPSPHDATRCLFRGYSYASGTPSAVYIKFVMSKAYGEGAHRLLAKHRLAPQLLWCGEIICGKTLVVMEALRQVTGIEQPLHPRETNEEDINIVERDIGKALTILRAHHFVHGDVHPENIVIANKRACLIDFDSAGEAGVARYPDNLNPAIKWPAAATSLRGQLVTFDDDIFRLKRTIVELRGRDKHDKRDRPDDSEADERSSKRSRSDDGSGGVGGLSQNFRRVDV